MTLTGEVEVLGGESRFRLDFGTLLALVANVVTVIAAITGVYVSLQGELISLGSKVDMLLKNNARYEVWMADIDKRISAHETVSALLRQDVERLKIELSAYRDSDRRQDEAISRLRERNLKGYFEGEK